MSYDFTTLCALIVTILLATMLAKRSGIAVADAGLENRAGRQLPGFLQAIAGAGGVLPSGARNLPKAI